MNIGLLNPYPSYLSQPHLAGVALGKLRTGGDKFQVPLGEASSEVT